MSIRSAVVAAFAVICFGSVAMMGAGLAIIPAIPAELHAKYVQIALSYFPPAPFLSMEAIDTVRYHQDWSQPTERSINQLASMFPYCWQEEEEKKKIHNCRIRSLDEVADRLGFTDEEKELAHIYVDILNELNP